MRAEAEGLHLFLSYTRKDQTQGITILTLLEENARCYLLQINLDMLFVVCDVCE